MDTDLFGQRRAILPALPGTAAPTTGGLPVGAASSRPWSATGPVAFGYGEKSARSEHARVQGTASIQSGNAPVQQFAIGMDAVLRTDVDVPGGRPRGRPV